MNKWWENFDTELKNCVNYPTWEWDETVLFQEIHFLNYWHGFKLKMKILYWLPILNHFIFLREVIMSEVYVLIQDLLLFYKLLIFLQYLCLINTLEMKCEIIIWNICDQHYKQLEHSFRFLLLYLSYHIICFIIYFPVFNEM